MVFQALGWNGCPGGQEDSDLESKPVSHTPQRTYRRVRASTGKVWSPKTTWAD